MSSTTDTVAVVAHDAGGAEILSSFIRRTSMQPLYFLEGPAIGVFKRKIDNINVLLLEQALEHADWLLTGTSWQSEIELDAITMARKMGKRSVSFLDHWVNYRERFERNGILTLPDELWVADEYAKALACETFPDLCVRLTDNPYLKDMQEQAKQYLPQHTKVGAALDVLYLGQPVREPALRMHNDALFWGYTEEDALRYFLQSLEILGSPVERINIRLHPSEPAGKYDWVQAETPVYVNCAQEPDLLKQIMQADVVAGCASMAMVIALSLGKKVISTIPPAGPECSLPFKEIIQLKKLSPQTAMPQTIAENIL